MEIRNEAELDLALSEPRPYVLDALRKTPGDIVILGVAGKMGPTLARMAVRALEAIGSKARVIGVARFSKPEDQAKLESWGIKTLKGDLLDEKFVAGLPDAPNVIYMPAMKFGSSGNESLTWAMNAYLPTVACRKYPKSRIAAFSTGNVYELCPLHLGGSQESDRTAPIGEYGMSCLGRERMFEYFSRTNGTPVSILRLSYACELRYGVVVDVARKVFAGEPISLATGVFNAIWQADANAVTLASLAHASAPPFVLNLTGPEAFSVRRTAEEFGRLLDRQPVFVGEESNTAFFSNATLCHELFGYPAVTAKQMMRWIAAWIQSGGGSLGKPVHFETRDGKY